MGRRTSEKRKRIIFITRAVLGLIFLILAVIKAFNPPAWFSSFGVPLVESTLEFGYVFLLFVISTLFWGTFEFFFKNFLKD